MNRAKVSQKHSSFRTLSEKRYLWKVGIPQVAQWWRIRLPMQEMQHMQETWLWSLGQVRSPEEGNKLTPVYLPGKSHGQRSLMGYSPWGCKRGWRDLATKQTTAHYNIWDAQLFPHVHWKHFFLLIFVVNTKRVVSSVYRQVAQYSSHSLLSGSLPPSLFTFYTRNFTLAKRAAEIEILIYLCHHPEN